MLRIFLFILCALAFVGGVGCLAVAQSALHEIEAFILFLISAVLLVGAAVVEAINIARKKIESLLRRPVSTNRLENRLPTTEPVIAPPRRNRV